MIVETWHDFLYALNLNSNVKPDFYLFFIFLLLTESQHLVVLSSPRYQIFHLEQTRALPGEIVIEFWIFGDMQ